MKRSEILLWLCIALYMVYCEANNKKNQKKFFDFWKSEKTAPAGLLSSDDLFLEEEEGSGFTKENTRGDDEDFNSIDGGSGFEATNLNINLIDDEDSEEEDLWEEEEKIMKEGDDEDLFEGSGSGGAVEVEEEIVSINVKPVENVNIRKTTTSSPLTPCQNLRNSAYAVAQFIPECDKLGAFKKLQCLKDKSRCWCVNSNGVEIPGTNREKPIVPDCEFGENLSTCVFQLVQHSQGLLGAYKPTCTLDGMYEPIQCQGSECWCVDKDGNEKIGTIKNKPDTPNCDQFEPKTTVKTVGVKIPDSKSGYDVESKEEPDNTIDVVVDPIDIDDETKMEEEEEETNSINDKESQRYGDHPLRTQEATMLAQPGLLAAIIGATVVGLLCIVLLVMFVVYRMRKKDEGSYPLEEQKYPNYQYTKAPEKEFYA